MQHYVGIEIFTYANEVELDEDCFQHLFLNTYG